MKRPRNGGGVAKLNVGGTVFHVATDTLAGMSYFDPLRQGRFPWETSEDGTLFIDRDGELFGVILQALRTMQRPDLFSSLPAAWPSRKAPARSQALASLFAGCFRPQDQSVIATKRSSLLAECLFWGADSVALMITGETNPMHLRPQDRSIREEEMTAEEGTSPLEDALEVAFLGRLPEDLQLPLLFRTEEQPAPNPCESLMDFERRFSKICGSAAEAIMRVPNIVFAGSAVLSAFLGEGSFTPRPQTKKRLDCSSNR